MGIEPKIDSNSPLIRWALYQPTLLRVKRV